MTKLQHRNYSNLEVKFLQQPLLDNIDILNLNNYELKTLVIKSKVLKKNPLGDPHIRNCPVLVPYQVTKKLKVIFVLSGFTGNGGKNFNERFHDENFPQLIDRLSSKNLAPDALYVFVDAMTFWGGSQFVNSKGMGRYEDYVVQELLPLVKETWDISTKAKDICVFGGSSGGYGALHLVSRYPQQFGVAVAIAPDSFFEMSLLPEIYEALPYIKKWGDVPQIKKKLQKGNFLKGPVSFHVLNVLGMSMCYSDNVNCYKKFESPVDLKTSQLNPKIWKTWKSKDPIEFLKKRNLSKIFKIYLDSGERDQFHLQYGSRQIRDILRSKKVKHSYNEFDGNHFDISSRRPEALLWLKKLWS